MDLKVEGIIRFSILSISIFLKKYRAGKCDRKKPGILK